MTCSECGGPLGSSSRHLAILQLASLDIAMPAGFAAGAGKSVRARRTGIQPHRSIVPFALSFVPEQRSFTLIAWWKHILRPDAQGSFVLACQPAELAARG
jgi:hypothetical protein